MNRYTYCANNPIIYIDPSGNVYYYFYGKDQKKVFEINQKLLEESGEIVYPFYIDSEEKFQGDWNNTDMTYEDSVIINLHLSENGVQYINMNELDSKEIGYLYLLLCQSGRQDAENNAASQILDHSSIHALVACDGTHYRTPIGKKTVVHSVPGDNVFRFISNGNLSNYRVSEGFVLHTKLDDMVQKQSIGHAFTSILSMIDKTHKVYDKTKKKNIFRHSSTRPKFYDFLKK